MVGADGKQLLISYENKPLELWRIEEENERIVFVQEQQFPLPKDLDVYDGAWFDPQFVGPSQEFVTCSAKGVLHFWDRSTQEYLHSMTLTGDDATLECPVVSWIGPKNKPIMAVATQGTLKIWSRKPKVSKDAPVVSPVAASLKSSTRGQWYPGRSVAGAARGAAGFATKGVVGVGKGVTGMAKGVSGIATKGAVGMGKGVTDVAKGAAGMATGLFNPASRRSVQVRSQTKPAEADPTTDPTQPIEAPILETSATPGIVGLDNGIDGEQAVQDDPLDEKSDVEEEADGVHGKHEEESENDVEGSLKLN